MGATADKIKGTTNEAIGKAKQGVGNLVGSDKLKTEGLAQEGFDFGQVCFVHDVLDLVHLRFCPRNVRVRPRLRSLLFEASATA